VSSGKLSTGRNISRSNFIYISIKPDS